MRAAISMARLWSGQGKRDEAFDLLAPVYGWFTEGFHTRDLKGAKALCRRELPRFLLPAIANPMRYACSHPDLFAVHDASDSRPFDHPVLKCCVVLELSHRELAAQTPRVEDETIGIEHGVAIGEPFAFR